MCLNETFIKVSISENLSDVFSERSETRRYFMITAFHFCFGLSCQGGQRKSGRIGTEWNTSAPGLCDDVLICWAKTQRP
jgi:hypothetical protein